MRCFVQMSSQESPELNEELVNSFFKDLHPLPRVCATASARLSMMSCASLSLGPLGDSKFRAARVISIRLAHAIRDMENFLTNRTSLSRPRSAPLRSRPAPSALCPPVSQPLPPVHFSASEETVDFDDDPEHGPMPESVADSRPEPEQDRNASASDSSSSSSSSEGEGRRTRMRAAPVPPSSPVAEASSSTSVFAAINMPELSVSPDTPSSQQREFSSTFSQPPSTPPRGKDEKVEQVSSPVRSPSSLSVVGSPVRPSAEGSRTYVWGPQLSRPPHTDPTWPIIPPYLKGAKCQPYFFAATHEGCCPYEIQCADNIPPSGKCPHGKTRSACVFCDNTCSVCSVYPEGDGCPVPLIHISGGSVPEGRMIGDLKTIIGNIDLTANQLRRPPSPRTAKARAHAEAMIQHHKRVRQQFRPNPNPRPAKRRKRRRVVQKPPQDQAWSQSPYPSRQQHRGRGRGWSRARQRGANSRPRPQHEYYEQDCQSQTYPQVRQVRASNRDDQQVWRVTFRNGRFKDFSGTMAMTAANNYAFNHDDSDEQ